MTTKILIAGASFCVIGWTAYFVGNAAIDWLERQQTALAAHDAAVAAHSAWQGCMDRMYQPPHVVSFNLRNQLCADMGYVSQ